MSVQVDNSLVGELYCSVCERLFEEGEVCPVDGTRLMKLVAPIDPLLGRELDGRYAIVEKIGQGGMGAIYRGTQRSIEREVAIKVIHTQYMTSTETIRRFLREAKLASRLNHPNAVGVVDFGQTEDGVFYLVMELIRGRTLDEMIKGGVKFTPRRIVRIGRQVCDALAAAHALDIIHRDLKPANIMLLDEHPDFVKVLDFGLAKSLATEATTMSGSGLLGTPAFLPPEVAQGARCDGRADLYSLGCILYLLGTQRLPFEAASPHELVALHGTQSAPPMTGVPEQLAKVIDRMLARDRDERFQTALEAREALEEALIRFTPQAMDTPMPVENASPRRRHSNTDLDLLLRGRISTPVPVAAPRRRWFAAAAALAIAAAIVSVVLIAKSTSSDEVKSSAAESLPSPPPPPPPAPPPLQPANASVPSQAPQPTAAPTRSAVQPKPVTRPAKKPPRKPPRATTPSRGAELPF